MKAGSEATAPRKHDPRKWGRLLCYGHANTKRLGHEPVDRGRIRVERRGFGPLARDRRQAERRGWRPFLDSCRVWRGAAVFLHLASAGLALAPVCIVPTQDSDQV
jgi:hypothetical protein